MSLLHNPHDEQDLQDEILENRKRFYGTGTMCKQRHTQSFQNFLSAMSARRDPRIMADSLYLPGEIGP